MTPTISLRSNSAFAGASITLLFSIFSMGVGIALNVIVARSLGPEIKGQIDIMNATSGLATMIVGLSISSGVIFSTAQNQGLSSRLAWHLLGMSIIQSGVVWIGLAILIRAKISTAFIPKNYSSWGIVAITLMTFASLLGSYGRAFLLGLQEYIRGTTLDFLARFLAATATIGALIYFRFNHDLAAIAVFIGSIGAAYVMALVALTMSLPRLVIASSAGFWQMLKYSLSSYAADLVQFANYRLDVFFVAYFVGVSGVALYGIAVNIAQVLWLLPNAMQSVLFPRFSAMTDERKKADETAQLIRFALFYTILAVGILSLVASWLIGIILGVRFLPSLKPLWLLLPGIASFCVAKFASSYLAANGKPQLNFKASLMGLGATLFFDFALIPNFGIAGAAIASSFSYIISAVATFYYFIHESGLSIKHIFQVTMEDVRLALRILRQIWHNVLSHFQKQ